MALGSYPRVTVQGTSNTNNPQNGYGLMIFNSTSGQYEAATASTFGGGGGGDATAANQATQITEAQQTNTLLTLMSNGANLNDLLMVLNTIVNELVALNSSVVDGTQRVVLQDTTGNTVDVNSTLKALNVKTT